MLGRIISANLDGAARTLADISEFASSFVDRIFYSGRIDEEERIRAARMSAHDRASEIMRNFEEAIAKKSLFDLHMHLTASAKSQSVYTNGNEEFGRVKKEAEEGNNRFYLVNDSTVLDFQQPYIRFESKDGGKIVLHLPNEESLPVTQEQKESISSSFSRYVFERVRKTPFLGPDEEITTNEIADSDSTIVCSKFSSIVFLTAPETLTIIDASQIIPVNKISETQECGMVRLLVDSAFIKNNLEPEHGRITLAQEISFKKGVVASWLEIHDDHDRRNRDEWEKGLRATIARVLLGMPRKPEYY